MARLSTGVTTLINYFKQVGFTFARTMKQLVEDGDVKPPKGLTKEEKLNSAYSEWLTTGETVKAIAERHDVSLNTLSGRINRGLLTRERV